MMQKWKQRKLRKVKLHNGFPSGGTLHTVQSGLIRKAYSRKEGWKQAVSIFLPLQKNTWSVKYILLDHYSYSPTNPSTTMILQFDARRHENKVRIYRYWKAALVVQRQRAGLWYPSSRVRTRPKPSDFQGEKILSTPSFGGEVKPSVPCRSFKARKRSLNVTWKQEFRQNYRTFLAHSSTFRRWVLSRGDTRGEALWRKLERLTKMVQ